jgi:hypothetical protein
VLHYNAARDTSAPTTNTLIATFRAHFLEAAKAAQCYKHMNGHEGFVLPYKGAMAITVRELLDVPNFGTRLFAGEVWPTGRRARHTSASYRIPPNTSRTARC